MCYKCNIAATLIVSICKNDIIDIFFCFFYPRRSAVRVKINQIKRIVQLGIYKFSIVLVEQFRFCYVQKCFNIVYKALYITVNRYEVRAVKNLPATANR